jgi:hypothetical protein
MEKALKITDLDRELRRGEYAEEITGVLVDQISGDYAKNDYEYESETFLTEEGFIDRRNQVEQGKFVVVGTGNITLADSKILADLDQQAAPMMIAPTGHGWIVSLMPCRQDEVESLTQEMAGIGFSEAFVTLWKGLRERGYGLMQIDQDACPHPDFAAFEW